jgi:CRISPR/Cas system CMR subunit Cmr4 (Cas7 group RAMP superfamily)
MEEPTQKAPLGAPLPESTGARWDRTDGAAAAVVRVECTLEATEPLHIGGEQEEDAETTSDLPLLTDPRSGRPLLPGTTLAGALRSYLRARELGFPGGKREEESAEKQEEKRQERSESLALTLFGGRRAGGGDYTNEERPTGDDGDAPMPSTVTVDDALGHLPDGASVEVYEGNRLAGASRTAEEEALYSRVAWPAGTTFDLHFELKLPAGEERATRCCTALVSALKGLEETQAGIRLGGRKRRGFGQVRARDWRVRCFDLSDTEGFLSWVHEGHKPLDEIEGRQPTTVAQLCDVLGGKFGDVTIIPDARRHLLVEAACTLPHGLLDRTAGTTGGPDVVHRRAFDAQAEEKRPRPVLTGTQMGGALRARATRIAHRLASDDENAQDLVEAVFGNDPDPEQEEEDLHASRLWIDQSFIEGNSDPVGLMELVQNRIQITPWTQAPVQGAPFNEQPVRGGPDVEVTLRWRLDRPSEAEVGLVLHLLKDLWNGDLATAGTQSIGRGRFQGKCATLVLRDGAEDRQRWTFESEGSDSGLRFTEGAPEDLTEYADALCDRCNETSE